VRHREKWPEVALVFDTETTIDTQQKLTFGAYRICKLVDGKYLTFDEGLFRADDLTDAQSNMIAAYVVEKLPQIQVRSFPPKLRMNVYTRSEFVRKVFWKYIQEGALIVGFNLPFDLTRIAAGWRKGRTNSWSLIFSLRRSRKSGQMEPDPERPRIRLKSKDSQSAFISLLRPQRPEEWPKPGRFLDLHTLASALFGESMRLEALCERLETGPKLDYEPTGKISIAEINYCRADVRATCGALNGLKREFDMHPVRLSPDFAYSPASIAKSYLHAMGIIPPNRKFKVPNRVLGIAMQAYFGGRAECRIRRVAVPTTHTDFKSQYPTVNALLGNADVLVAKSVSFPDASREVRRLVKKITPESLFDPTLWKKLRFFALIRPQSDFLPVRAFYNEQTVNIGINEFTSTKPIWYAGPDIVASVLLTGKIPRIDKAIRVVPHGKQGGLKPTNLRGIVSVDPAKHDFFRDVVEQRERHKSDESLAEFLKVLANSGSYGLFVEISPEKRSKRVRSKVFSGNESYSTSPTSFVEKHGNWYFPPLASLITAGGRLLLAILERLVADAGGSYLFCDTDSMCVVGSRRGELIACPGGTHKLPNGVEAIKALSWGRIDAIAQKFSVLNPYDATAVTEILKVEEVNFDARQKRRKLSGFAISAKRYALYEKSGGEINIIDAKAHGLGYLFPPCGKERR
jgi:hypothetical protein